ncbi:MAG: FAD-binding protein [Bacillota bacterium]|nr:FAD-binding protein [Bacillota bacterium]
MRQIMIDYDRCSCCGLCAASCPLGTLKQEDERMVVGDQCNLCCACLAECPEQALSLSGAVAEIADVSGWHGIWVFAEQTGGRLSSVSRELLGESRRMSKNDIPVTAILLGSGVRDLVAELVAYGADTVRVADDPALNTFREETYTTVLASMATSYRPSVILFGATARGRSLAPRLAARLGTGLTADCTQLEIDEQGLLIQTRPAYGGNIMATIVCRNHRPQMATVRPKVMRALDPDWLRRAEVHREEVDAQWLKARTAILEQVDEAEGTVNLEDANVIVAGGRGVGGPEGFRVLHDLARELGGAVAASRAAVDLGWIPYSQQVGQTGKTVSPKVYIACGISGAVQHLAGMRSADMIVAINRNPEAPIFRVATYGLAGDLFSLLPILTKELRARHQQAVGS